MPINRIQFQHGMSLPDFIARYGREDQCIEALAQCRWPGGFQCPRCSGATFYRIETAGRPLFQCRTCRHQASLTAGTLLESSKLPLHKWFLAIYIISQAKTGISSLALKRHLGVDYRTAWLMHHKLLHAMAKADSEHTLRGNVVVDDAYLGGEKPGAPGRGSTNKVPFVAAVSLNEKGHPIYMKATAISGFTRQAIASWAKASLKPGCDVLSDGLACFSGIVEAECAHSYVVVGVRKPRELSQFKWVNTVLGNLKTKIKGAHKHFNFSKYANRYLGAFAYRFNHRFDLAQLVPSLLAHAVRTAPLTEQVARSGAEVHH
jgi:transposase-like protein